MNLFKLWQLDKVLRLDLENLRLTEYTPISKSAFPASLRDVFFPIPRILDTYQSVWTSTFSWKNINHKSLFIIILHCVKIVQIRSFSGPYFPPFELGDLLRKSPYSVQTRENTDQKNSVFGHISHSDSLLCSIFWLMKLCYFDNIM